MMTKISIGMILLGLMPIGINCVALNIPDPTHESVKDAVYRDLEPISCKLDYPEQPWHAYMQSPHTGKYIDIDDLPEPGSPFAGFRAWMVGWTDNPFEEY